MNSIEVVKGLLNAKKYDVVSEYCKIQHGADSTDVVVKEYTGANVRMCKNKDGGIEIFYPKTADVVMEGAIANAIANGTIFDDADEVDNNATMIEKTTIPCSAMTNKGLDEPETVKKIIAIVIGKMDDDGRFTVSDVDRDNGVKFVKDITDVKRDGGNIRDVINNYTEKENDETYDSVVGKQMTDLSNEVDDINSVDYEDTVDDVADTVEDYGDYDMDSFEKEDGKEDNDEEVEDGSDTGFDNGDDSDDGESELSEEPDDDDNDSDDNDDEDDESDNDDKDEKKSKKKSKKNDSDDDEPVEECGDLDTVEESCANTPQTDANGNPKPVANTSSVTSAPVEECGDTACKKSKVDKMIEDKQKDDAKYKAYEEGFLTKKPKKLKPIGRDTVAYITTMMNDIHSANSQAMLAGYTCNKLELVDFYITAIDTQDSKYVVPHTRAYLVTLKNDLEILLARILRIRPINRSEQIWRVNYPM